TASAVGATSVTAANNTKGKSAKDTKAFMSGFSRICCLYIILTKICPFVSGTLDRDAPAQSRRWEEVAVATLHQPLQSAAQALRCFRFRREIVAFDVSWMIQGGKICRVILLEGSSFVLEPLAHG